MPTCVPVPTPAEPNFSAPRFAFAAAISSATVVMPAVLPATSTYGWLVSGATGMKSFNGSYGRFFTNAAL